MSLWLYPVAHDPTKAIVPSTFHSAHCFAGMECGVLQPSPLHCNATHWLNRCVDAACAARVLCVQYHKQRPFIFPLTHIPGEILLTGGPTSWPITPPCLWNPLFRYMQRQPLTSILVAPVAYVAIFLMIKKNEKKKNTELSYQLQLRNRSAWQN